MEKEKGVWASIKCPRCGAPISNGSQECGHCHLEVDWVEISVPINRDGTETRVKGRICTPEGWRKL